MTWIFSLFERYISFLSVGLEWKGTPKCFMRVELFELGVKILILSAKLKFQNFYLKFNILQVSSRIDISSSSKHLFLLIDVARFCLFLFQKIKKESGLLTFETKIFKPIFALKRIFPWVIVRNLFFSFKFHKFEKNPKSLNYFDMICVFQGCSFATLFCVERLMISSWFLIPNFRFFSGMS